MEKMTTKRISVVLLLSIATQSVGIPYGNPHHFIESPKLSRWGEWGKLEHCPSDQVVVGMRLKVHANQGVKDDSGMNAVKFYCQNPYSSPEYAGDVLGITSLVGNDGEWKKDFFCPAASAGSSESKLLAVGFQLRSETSSGVKDDTAGNNLKLVCSDLYQKQGYTYLEGDGTQRGEWTERQLCWPGYAICALQTQVEVSRSMDVTGLNNMKVRCCKVDSGYIFQTASSSVTTNDTEAGNHGSGESSSTSVESGENSGDSASGKDNVSSQDNHRGDHAEDSVEEQTGWDWSAENRESPDEQELIAILDPEPSEENESSVIHSTLLTNNQSSTEAEAKPGSSTSGEEEEQQHSPPSSTSNEDDENLPEEIARIDQVDNSEAHQEEEEQAISTVTDSQQHPHSIPEEVVNALEDADSNSSANNDNADSDSIHNNQHEYNQQNNAKPFHWGSELTNLTDLAGLADNHLEEPKSSPRFGQIGVNETITPDLSSGTASQVCRVSYIQRRLIVASMLIFYLVKPF